MTWQRILLEPEQGPKLSEEELTRRIALHDAQLIAEQERISEIIHARLNLPRYRHPER